MTWLLCKVLGLHAPPAWHDPRWQLYWTCTRCRERQPGRLPRLPR